MSTLAERYENLKKKKEALEKRKIQCEVKKDSLTSEIKNDLATLNEKYGVSSLDEAKDYLARMDLELKTKADALEEELSKFEKQLDIEL